MYITLYKKCILSKDYTEVFDCTARTKEENNVVKHYSFFSEYLDTLTKITFEIEDVYITNEGSFNLPFTFNTNGDFFEYNYMRLSYYNTNEHEYRTTRYCFIDNIDIRNDIAIVSYTTDIWHSFSEFMTIRNSYLSRSRLLYVYNTKNENLSLFPYDIPVDYEGNKKLIYEPIFSGNTLYNLFVKLQVYNTSNSGDFNERYNHLGLLEDGNGQYNFTKEQIEDITQELVRMSGTNRWRSNLTGVTPNGAYVQLGNFYVIPASFGIGSQFKTNETGNNNWVDLTNSIGSLTPVYRISSMADTFTGTFLSKQFTIYNNFKNKKIGTLFNNIDIITNGYDFVGEILTIFNTFDMNIYLNVQNQIIDLTNDFEIGLPFTSVNGEVNQSLKMSRSLTNISAVLSLILGAKGIGAGAGIKSQSNLLEDKVNYAKQGPRRITSGTTKSLSKTEYYKDNTSSSIEGMSNGIISLAKANNPIYSSTIGTFGDTDGLLNCVLGGLFIIKIDSNNDNYVSKMIEETGYITYYIGSYDIIRLKETSIPDLLPFNVIKYDFINLYGDFSQDVADNLKQILLDGVKVWYSSSV